MNSLNPEATWTSRRRVEMTLAHREPDRIPYDLGGTVVTGIHRQAYARLRRTLGLPEVEVQIEDPTQQLARVDEDVKRRLEVDLYGVSPAKRRALKRPPWTEDGYEKMEDEWGIEWWKPVQGGFYFDMRRHPMEAVDTVQALARWQFPDPLDPARYTGLAERSDEFLNHKQVGCVLGRNAPGMLELALWLRGFENFFCDMAINQPFAEALLDSLCEYKMKYWAKALELVGANVMIVAEADDLAGQNGPLVNPELYRKLLKPRHARLFAFIRKQAAVPVKIFFHTCGAVSGLVHDLVDCGVDILNPVQVSAAGMDTRELKRRFGSQITFYGGGVDTQGILPRASPAEVRQEVRRRIEDLAPGGGFIFATVHNVQADVPPENIVAMWEALREFGVYPQL